MSTVLPGKRSNPLAPAKSAWTRLTVVGATTRSDLVVPSDETVATMLPRLLELLREPRRPAVTLVRPTGESLDVGRSVADQEVVDGEVLRLVSADAAPPPPEVADVTDVLSDAYAGRRDRWSARSREVTGAVALGVLGALLAVLGPDPRPLVVLTGAAALVMVAAVLGRLRATGLATALISLALGAVVPSAYRLSEPETQTGIGWLFPTATGLGIGVWLGLGLGFGLARGRRPALVGSALGLVLVSGPLWASTLGPDRAAALGAGAAVLVSGLLPRYAATAAGLTGLDDQVVEGRRRLRAEVQASVDRAYAALTWSTFGVASGVAVAAGVLLASGDPWAVGMGGAVLLVVALRTRVFPLAAQQMALWLAVAAAAVLGLVGQPDLDPQLRTLGLAGAAGLIMVLVLARPPAHLRARLRSVGDVVELLAVITLPPLLLGLFGVYGTLLDRFGS